MRRNNTFRWMIIIFAILLSLYFLYPTYRMETLSSDERDQLILERKLRELEHKAIKRGLDLQGGMHIVLEVDLFKMVETLAREQDAQFYNFLERKYRD